MKKLAILFAVITITVMGCSKKEGCTDPLAPNYDSAAEVDNGTCNGYVTTEGTGNTGGAEGTDGAGGAKTYTFTPLTTAPDIVYITSMHFVDDNTGWIGGNNGGLAITTDGGATWKKINIGVDVYVREIFFHDKNTGWIATAEGLLKSTDGGNTWTNEYSGSTGNGFYSVTFINSTQGWACGSNGVIVVTTNGGASWTKQDNPAGGSDTFKDIFFLDANNGWAVGTAYDVVNYRTTDGGVTWEKSGYSPCPMYEVFCTSLDNGWIAGKLKYKKSGSYWNTTLNDIDEYFFGVHFANDNVGAMVGEDGYVLFTENGGTDWTKIDVSTTESLREVYFTSANVGYIVGYNSTLIKITYE
jgi:photosystem II stability/assembly factor-like uncharacterized protein